MSDFSWQSGYSAAKINFNYWVNLYPPPVLSMGAIS